MAKKKMATSAETLCRCGGGAGGRVGGLVGSGGVGCAGWAWGVRACMHACARACVCACQSARACIVSLTCSAPLPRRRRYKPDAFKTFTEAVLNLKFEEEPM